MLKSIILCGGSAMAVAASLCATNAFAATATATAGAGAAASAESGGMASELVVVAQKREQKIETVPVAITAFSAKQREIIGIRTTQDLSDFTPGLSYYAIADEAYIRGIGRNTTNLATAAGVAVYNNGVYYGANGSISLQHDSLFIGNVEVDRGPQNTLHGSNSDGGTINYIEKRPTDSFFAEGRVGVANYGYYYGEAVVSGPLNDNWKFRIGGNYSSENGGYFKNLDGPPEGGAGPQGNSGRWHYFEAQIQGKIGDNLDMWTMVSSGEFHTNFHTVATIGSIPDTPFLANAPLGPNAFYGFCAFNEAQFGCNVAGNPATQDPGTVVPGSATGLAVLANQFPGNNPSNLNPHNFIETSTQKNTENDNIAVASDWKYHLPGMDLEYVLGYQTFFYHLEFGAGIDAGLTSFKEFGLSPAPADEVTIFPAGVNTLFVEKDESFSHEFNVLSTGNSPLQYILGAYWYHEHFEQPIGAGCMPQQPQVFSPVFVDPKTFAITPAPANPDGCLFNQDGMITYDDYAGFAHASYKFNDQWNVAGGLRYTSDHRAGSETSRLLTFCGAILPCTQDAVDITGGPTPGVVPGAGPQSLLPDGNLSRPLSASWSAVTGDATINWTPDASTLAYFRYARGYKAGGFAAGTFQGAPATANTPAVPAFTNPEYVDSFEIGLKKTIGSVFQLNGDLFYYNWQNDQQPLTVAQANGNQVTQLFNIPQSRIWGVELEAVWKPVDPVTLNFQYSYLNTQVTSMTVGGRLDCVENADDPGATAGPAAIARAIPCDSQDTTPGIRLQDLTGSELPEAPRNKVSFNAQYELKFDPGNLTFSGSVIWKDKTFGEIFNDPLALAPAYYTVNLRAVWDDAKDRYSIIAYVNNVTNTRGFDNVTETGIFPGFLVQGVGLTAPITFGMELQVRFR